MYGLKLKKIIFVNLVEYYKQIWVILINIIADTREQIPLWNECIFSKLYVGDYSIEGFENKIAIERKNPIDLIGTVTKGHNRFRRECLRAKDYDYFGVYVECSKQDMIKKNFKGSYHSRMRGYVVVKIIETMAVKYGFDLVWCDGRDDMRNKILDMFKTFINEQG